MHAVFRQRAASILHADQRPPRAAVAAATVASGSAQSGGEKDGGEKGNRASSSNGKASKGETKSQKRAVSLPHATAQSGATEPKSQKPSKKYRR